MKNKPVSRNFTCIKTDVMQTTKVKSVQYLGMVFNENWYWHDQVDQICASLVKYFGIFNHSKTLFHVDYFVENIFLTYQVVYFIAI